MILAKRLRIILTILLLSFLSVNALAQAGSPATAHRWYAGDGWRQNTTDNTQTNMWEPLVFASPNLQPKGIVRCASSAETESGLTAVKGTYHAADYTILASDFHACFNQQTETRDASVNAPTEGEDIVWFNFDIRPLAGTYQFQIVSNETLGWALYYVDTAFAQPTAAHGATGTSYPLPLGTPSGDPAHLVYADCGISGNGWSTITVPSFTLPTNYYLAMWLNDPTASEFPGSMNLTYKSRYGCGGSTCTIQYIKDELTCAENGYQACEWFGGSAGQWTITDNSQTPASSYTVTYYLGNADGTVGAMIGSPTTSANPTITLGTIPDGPVFVKICAVYPYGETHSLTLNPVSAYVPPGTSGYVACTSSATTGIHSGPTAPVVDGAPNTQNLNLATTNTANLTASATGGTGTITYAWTQLTADANTSFSFNSSTGNATFTVNSLPTPLPAFYEFKVVATDAIGCSSSETVQVVPLASLEPCGIYGDASVCEGSTGLVYTYGDPNTLTPYTLNTTDFAYKWTISGNGTITSEDDNTGTVTVNTNGDGSFILTMTIDNITGILPDRTCTYTVTVNPAPAAPTGGPNARCFTGTVELTASGCEGGTLTWYDMAVGGTVLGTGSPFTTPSISTTTSFYVSCTSADGCEGPRTEVVATVNTIGAVTATTTPTTCGLNNGSITITAPLGADITYSLNGGTAQASPTFSNLASGVYSIMAMSTAGCTSSGSATVAPSQPCLTYCSYTQGFWGNKNGLKMLPALLTTSMTLGRSGHSFTIPANSATMLYNAMPGTETPTMLKSGDCIMSTSPSGCFATQYRTSQGKFNNVLLSQTITLTLNTRLAGNPLLTLPIQSGCLVTGKGTFEMNQNVVNYLTYNGATATVSNLLDLANDLLGGTLTPGDNMGTVADPRIVPSYSDVTMAIDAINKGFDGCSSFNGYQVCSTLVVATRKAPDNLAVVNKVQVSAYPNPFTDQVRFIISSPVSGTATLDVFNLQGQKVKTIFQGTVTANIAQIIEYHVADVSRQSLVYIVTMNGERVTGKLLNSKE
jgi:hypothetical protein